VAFELHVWGQTSLSYTSTLAYTIPIISSVSSSGALDTRGGTSITLFGSSLGSPENSAFYSVSYGSDTGTEFSTTASSCTKVLAAGETGERVVCPAVAGVGGSLKFRLTIATRVSAIVDSAVTYANPVVSTVSAPSMQTSGSGTVVIAGDYFATATHSATLVVKYGPDGDPTRFTATGCTITTPHTHIQCTAGVGYGVSLKWTVTQKLLPSNAGGNTAYAPATVSSVTNSPFATVGSTGFVLK
jgi:hypothetical protein